MTNALKSSEGLQSADLRRVSADEHLILREDGDLVLEDDTWGTVDIVELQEDISRGTIEIDLDDPCVVEVQDVLPQAVLSPRATTPPPAPVPGTTNDLCGASQRAAETRRAAVRAMADGDFAKAQSVLGRAPRRRVLSEPRSR